MKRILFSLILAMFLVSCKKTRICTCNVNQAPQYHNLGETYLFEANIECNELQIEMQATQDPDASCSIN